MRAVACLMMLVLCACGGGGGTNKAPYPGIKLGKPYEIYGRWYEPKYNAHYDETGIASWYGPGFNGGHTSNGERFDENAMTAAHRTLPMPSIVRVTNLDNGLSAIIKINDRGPFSHDRIIDLSRASATKLGVIRTGTAKVRVQFLERETKEYVENLQGGSQYAMGTLSNVNPEEAGENEEQGAKPSLQVEAKTFGKDSPAPPLAQPAPPLEPIPIVQPVPGGTDEFSVVEKTPAPQPGFYQPSPPAPHPRAQAAAGQIFFVQAGTFGLQQNATNLVDRLSGDATPQIMEITLKGKKLYRVMVGPFNSRDDAKNMLSKLAAIGMPDAKIIRN